MLGSLVDSWLVGRYGTAAAPRSIGDFQAQFLDTPGGSVRLVDTGGDLPCVVIVPDGPNVIEHYTALLPRLSPTLRVVCFDMPGFGFSAPSASYDHTLDHGASAVLSVLDQLHIKQATLAFSCANGFYALRAARIAPERIGVAPHDVSVPCSMLWGAQDRSHRGTDPLSLRDCAADAQITTLPHCGHFPNLEHSDRFVELLLAQVVGLSVAGARA